MNKILFVTLCLVAGAFSAAVQQDTLAEGPECPIEDPLIREGPFPMNVTLDPLVAIEEGSQISNIIAEGLSTLRYKININVIRLTATFEVDIPKVTGNATFNADGYLDARPLRQETAPSGNFTGSGLGKVSANDVHAKGSATVYLTLRGRVQLRRLSLDEVTFSALALDLGENWNIGGATIDWEEYNRNVKTNFDEDWRQHKNALTSKIMLTANNILKNYTLKELIDLIGGGDKVNAEC